MLRKLTRTDPASTLGRLIRSPLRLIPSNTIIRIPSGINKGRRWICGSSIQRCWFGTYEFDKQDFVRHVIKPGMTVWDVGANVGFYTLAFAHLAGQNGSVIAFEPLAPNAAYLLRHLELNKLTNVKLVQAALADSTGLMGFSATMASTMGRLVDRDRHYLIPTISPESLLTILPESKPHLIKLDIEGAEGAVLRASCSLLERYSPDVLLAIHGKPQEEQCVHMLTKLRYKLFYLDGRPIDVSRALSSDEVFATRRNSVI
jgi:FkbM family methyltransferase